MKAEYWIDGPPERFERGMWLDTKYGIWIVDYVSDDGVEVGAISNGGAIDVDPMCVRRYCPMMPMAQVEEYARYYHAAWPTRSRKPLMSAAEWRERRAGDE